LGYVPSDMDGLSLRPVLFSTEEEEQVYANTTQFFLFEYHGFGENLKITTDTEKLPPNLQFQDQGVDLPDYPGLSTVVYMDTWNNTFSCLHSVRGYELGEVFCKYTCRNGSYSPAPCNPDTAEYWGEYYNMNDPKNRHQLKNEIWEMSAAKRYEWLEFINAFRNCSGQRQCNYFRSSLYQEEMYHIIDCDYDAWDAEREMAINTSDQDNSSSASVGFILAMTLVALFVMMISCLRGKCGRKLHDLLYRPSTDYTPLLNEDIDSRGTDEHHTTRVRVSYGARR